MQLLAITFLGVILPALILFGIAVLFAVLIVYLGKKLEVKQDERIALIEKELTGANCGACGYPGCAGFAKALAEGKAKPSDCASTPPENRRRIAAILGTKDEGGEPTMAVVCCNGGESCKNKYDYQGYFDCKSAEILAGGQKFCNVGCIGAGSCTIACPTHCIKINDEGFAEVDRERCTSCGVCIQTCPKKLFLRVPRSAKVYVACSNECRGKEVKDICSAGCLGCTLCAKSCPSGAIAMVNNLPRIDYSKCTGCGICASKCPTKCIKFLGDAPAEIDAQ